MSYYVAVPSDDIRYLIHYGTPRHSGRYPYGSGARPYQHGGNVAKTVFDPSIKKGKDKSPASPAEEITKKTEDAIKTSYKFVSRKADKSHKKERAEDREKKREEVSTMSDQELQNRINRIKMEEEYYRLTKSDDVKNGWDKAKDILENVGDIAHVAVDVAVVVAIAIAIAKKVNG